MNKKFFILIGVFLMLFSTVHAAGISIQDNRATADYWTSKNSAGETAISANDLEMLNLQIRQKAPSIVDLVKYPEKISAQTKPSLIHVEPPKQSFDDMLQAAQEELASLDLAEISLENGKTVIYKWGAAPSWLMLSTGVLP